MSERKKPVIHLSPAGIARYPRLTTPDTKFKPAGEYKITLIVGAEAAKPLIDMIDKAMLESHAEAKAADPKKAKTIKAAADKPYKVVTDDEGNETDKYSFNFKMAASGENQKTKEKWSRRPSLFDAKGKPLDPTKVNIGGGSKVKVAFELFKFYTQLVGAGVSLRLSAVQVITLVEYQGRDAKGYGFSEEEGGFDSTEGSDALPTETPAETDGTKTPTDAQEF